MTIGTITTIRAAFWLIPSLIRRPTRRVVERFREIRMEILVDLVAKHYLIGFQQGLDDCNKKETP